MKHVIRKAPQQVLAFLLGLAWQAASAQSTKPVENTDNSVVVPALDIVGFELLLSNFNRHVSSSSDYNVSRGSLRRKLRGPWVVDNDLFSVNQFAHPYQGSLYHGAGRARGGQECDASSSRFAMPWTHLAALLVLLLIASLARADTVQFALHAPRARQVFLAGEMTDWDKGKQAMTRDADGVWRLSVTLAPGQWIYKFVVDGRWVHDPGTSEHDADGRGGQHSFVFVGEGPWMAPAATLRWPGDDPHREVERAGSQHEGACLPAPQPHHGASLARAVAAAWWRHGRRPVVQDRPH
jgi:hypothetical protein